MGKEVKKEKVKKIFLDDLPRKEGIGKNKDKQTIDWTLSIGYKVRFIYDDIEGWLEIIDYKENHLHIKYLDNPIYAIFTGNFIDCRLGGLLNKITNEFRYNIGDFIKDEYRDITITDRKLITEEIIYDDKKRKCKRKIKLNKKWYKFKCNICGFECGEHYKNQEYKKEHWIVEESLSKGIKSLCCDNKIVIEGINDIPTTEPWIVKYFEGGYDEAKLYNKSSSKSITPICPECGRVKDKPMKICGIYRQRSIGCKFCGDGISYGEKIMISVLEQIQVEFNAHKVFEWSNKKEYDFYIPYDNIIIEIHGIQHYESAFQGIKTSEKGKRVRTLIEEQTNDKFKIDIALLNNINEYISIDCRESNLKWIKYNILSSNLSKLFNLIDIDWDEADRFALSSRVKETCNYWNNGIKSTLEISKIMNICRSTATTYLKKGNSIGLCAYNGKDEIVKANIRKRKIIEAFKDEVSLGKFHGMVELIKTIEGLFKININSGRISEVCNGKRTNFKGFVFRYV